MSRESQRRDGATGRGRRRARSVRSRFIVAPRLLRAGDKRAGCSGDCLVVGSGVIGGGSSVGTLDHVGNGRGHAWRSLFVFRGGIIVVTDLGSFLGGLGAAWAGLSESPLEADGVELDDSFLGDTCGPVVMLLLAVLELELVM